MIYYTTIFLTVLLLIWFSERILKRNPKMGLFISFCAIVLLCIFTGFRANSVGTDVEIYIVPQLTYAKSFSSLLDYSVESGVELFNSVLLFLCAKISNDTTIILALYQFLVVTPVFFVLYKKRKDISITFGMLVYLMLIYHLSLNIMRQSVAGALLFVALVLYEEKKYKYAIIWCVCASLFHASAPIIIFIYGCTKYVTNGRLATLKKVVLILVVVIMIINIEQITSFIINDLGLFLIEYYERLMMRKEQSINVYECALRGILALLPTICISSNKKNYKFYSFLLLVGYIISFATIVSEYLIRLSYYFYFVFIPALSFVPSRFKKQNGSRCAIYVIEIFFLILYWYIIYIGWGWHDTMPFTFK